MGLIKRLAAKLPHRFSTSNSKLFPLEKALTFIDGADLFCAVMSEEAFACRTPFPTKRASLA